MATPHENVSGVDSFAVPAAGSNFSTPVVTELRSALCRLVYPPLICVGVLCNLAALATFQSRRLRRSPVSLGLSALAVLDTLVLAVSAGRFWSKYQLGFDWLVTSVPACRLGLFLEYWAVDCSVWTLLLVTAQRYAGTRLPLRAAKLCSRRRTRPLLLAAAALCAVKNSPLLARADVHANPLSGPLCQIMHDRRLWVAFAWTDAVFRFLVPWPSLALLNAGIWSGVRAASRFRRRARLAPVTLEPPSISLPSFTAASSLRLQQQHLPTQHQHHHHAEDGRRMLSMLVAVNLLFLICQTPFCAFSLADSLLGLLQKAVQFRDVQAYVVLATSGQVALTFVYASHAANFFLYFMSGRLFRRTLLRTLRQMCRRVY